MTAITRAVANGLTAQTKTDRTFVGHAWKVYGCGYGCAFDTRHNQGPYIQTKIHNHLQRHKWKRSTSTAPRDLQYSRLGQRDNLKYFCTEISQFSTWQIRGDGGVDFQTIAEEGGKFQCSSPAGNISKLIRGSRWQAWSVSPENSELSETNGKRICANKKEPPRLDVTVFSI